MKEEITYNFEEQIITVTESDKKYTIDLRNKLFNFAANTIRLLMILPKQKEFDVFRNQLSKSATSIGANYEESQAASFAEFRQRINICLREARETAYWLRLMKEIQINTTKIHKDKLNFLLQEIDVIQKILGSIAYKIQGKKNEK